MRLRSVTGMLLASLLLFATGGPSSFAESEHESRYFHLQRGYVPPQRYAPSQRPATRREQPARAYPAYGRDPRAYQVDPRQAYPRQPPPGYYYPQQAPPAYYNPFAPFGYQPPPQQARPYERRERPVQRARAPAVPAAPAAAARQRKPAVEASTHIAVFGDSLADLVAHGLEDALETREDIAVVRRTRGDSGLVRTDHHDWPKAIREFLSGDNKVTFAVVMLGANDRQTIREGEASHEPLSERWREIYRERVDAIVQAFSERRIPLVWVGVPPMRNDRLSADLITLNGIYRERVQKAGGVYVDIWEAFVNDQNRYDATGPDVAGQIVRLRTNDGVHFTRAGARKAAHFAEVEIKRLMETRAPAVAVPAAPAGPAEPGKTLSDSEIDNIISAALPPLPEPDGLPSLPARPLAGPVVPLNRADVSPGGALLKAPPAPADAYLADRALRDGMPLPPRPGRADDFRWPRS